jgi:hypothetical protein
MKSETDLERQVIQHILQGDHPSLSQLRAQWQLATLKNREFSGSGFFTNVAVPADARSLGQSVNFEIRDVNGDISGVFCGFLLFIRGGVIDFLECHVWGDKSFPPTPVVNRLFFMRHRDAHDPMLVESADRDGEALFRKLPRPE